MASVEYGISKLEMMPANADGTFPNFETAANKVEIGLIVIDSFNKDKDDDQTNDLMVENFDSAFLRLPGSKGLRNMTFQSYDLSAEQYAYFFGYEEDTDGAMVEVPGFELPQQAMRITTRKIGNYPARWQIYPRVDVRVKEAGTLGKNGLPNITFNITVPANVNESGQELPAHKWGFNA